MDRLLLDLSQVKVESIEEKPKPTARRIFTEAPEAPEVSFDDMLSASIRKVNSLQLEADDKVRRLAIGEVTDISEVVLASSRAEVSLKLLMELRNKLVDAYQSLSRISG
ncbi:Flagellar hook-basal body complex protein FliE [Fretibacterium fastidiosum]